MKKSIVFIFSAMLAFFAFCQGESGRRGANPASGGPQAGSPGAVEPASPPASGPAAGPAKPVGIGPVKNLSLGPVDKTLADKGKGLFGDRCSMCHSLTEAKTGPPLGNILSEVAPEFVMNFLLNTGVMEQKDPRIMALVKKYALPMPAPGLDKDQARAIMEYFRTTGKAPRP